MNSMLLHALRWFNTTPHWCIYVILPEDQFLQCHYSIFPFETYSSQTATHYHSFILDQIILVNAPSSSLFGFSMDKQPHGDRWSKLLLRERRNIKFHYQLILSQGNQTEPKLSRNEKNMNRDSYSRLHYPTYSTIPQLNECYPTTKCIHLINSSSLMH